MCFHLYYLHFFVFHCTRVRMSYVLNSYLLTYSLIHLNWPSVVRVKTLITRSTFGHCCCCCCCCCIVITCHYVVLVEAIPTSCSSLVIQFHRPARGLWLSRGFIVSVAGVNRRRLIKWQEKYGKRISATVKKVLDCYTRTKPRHCYLVLFS